MDVGLSIRHSMQSDPALTREIAITAEQKGIRSIWVPEHTVVPADYESRYPYQPDARLPFPSDTIYCDALGMLDHIAAVTSTIRLSTNVIPIITRNPIALAKQAATVDLLSGGRLELGLGSGWLAEEAEVLGLPTDKRGGRLDETIEILRKAWTGEAFAHDGQFWQFPEIFVSPAPPQGPGLPLWIGGSGPRAVRTIETSAIGAVLPPGPPGLEILPKMRESLDDKAMIALPLAIQAESPNDCLLERCSEVRGLGADHILVYTDPDPRLALATVAELDVDGIGAIA